MRTYLIALALALVPTTLYSQIIMPDSNDPYKPMIAHIQGTFPEGAEIRTTWSVPDALSLVPTKDTEIHLWGPPGDYKISATVVWMKFNVVTVDGKELRVMEAWDLVQYEKPITITGTKPTPPDNPDNPPEPGPDPPAPPVDIPEDEFDNLARSVNEWASSLSNRKAVASNYRTAHLRLSGASQPILPTIDAAVAFIATENRKIPLDNASWSTWASKIDPVWKDNVRDRNSAARFFELVALGLDPQP